MTGHIFLESRREWKYTNTGNGINDPIEMLQYQNCIFNFENLPKKKIIVINIIIINSNNIILHWCTFLFEKKINFAYNKVAEFIILTNKKDRKNTKKT